MNVDLEVILPVANPIRFTRDNVVDNARASFDKRRYFKTINATSQQRRFPQPFESTDPLRPQYYSNFPLQKLEVINCDEDIFQVYTPALAIQYRGKKYRSDAKFSSINDKLFIYFESGQEYSDEDFLVPGDQVDLLGRLPNIRAEVGNIIRYKIAADFEAASISSIAWSPTLNAHGFLTDVDITLLSPVDGLVEVTYNEKNSNLYQQAVNLLPLLEGEYFLRLSFGVSSYTISFTSEPLEVRISHPKTLAIEYRHNGTFEEIDIWSYIYLSDWKNVIRMPIDFYEVDVAGEVDLDENDNGVPRMLRAVPYRQLAFKAYNIPGWLVDKLSVIFSHDSKKINEYYWENETLGEFNIIARADLGTFEIKLRQVDDRTNFTNEFTEDITAEFDPASFEDLDFEGEVVTAQFISNTLGVFHFVSLPEWIETDVDTFQNGDIVEFTIAENTTFFNRAIELIAISDDFDGLQVPITFEQLFDTSEPLFIDVDDHEVLLNGAANSNQLLNVVSSGDYNISFSGAHTFTAVKESGFTQVRISEPTQNDDAAARTGVVRLALIADPLVFIDINVIQSTFRTMISLTPDEFDPVSSAGGELVTVVLTNGIANWQASPPPSWLHYDTSLQTNTVTPFSMFIDPRPPFIPPRSTVITFYNVANPSDSLHLLIEQN